MLVRHARGHILNLDRNRQNIFAPMVLISSDVEIIEFRAETDAHEVRDSDGIT